MKDRINQFTARQKMGQIQYPRGLVLGYLLPINLSVWHFVVFSVYGVLFDVVCKLPGAGAVKCGTIHSS